MGISLIALKTQCPGLQLCPAGAPLANAVETWSEAILYPPFPAI